MGRVLGRDEIYGIIPHRYENVLLDRIELSEKENNERSGAGEVSFRRDDGEGRGIFIVKDPEGNDIYYPFMFMEFFALGAITLMEEKIRQGLVAVFSSIRKVVFSGGADAGTPLASHVTLKGETSGFHRFAGTVQNNGDTLVDLQIMAYGVDFSAQGMPADSEAKKTELPSFNEETGVECSLFGYKRPELVCADSIRFFSAEEKALVTEYTYPDTHPFTKGHFPDNPVMMGIMQIMAASDAGELLAARLDVENSNFVTDSILAREDGTVVCEVKKLDLQIRSQGVFPGICAVKTVAFRDMIRPGEKLYCRTSCTG